MLTPRTRTRSSRKTALPDRILTPKVDEFVGQWTTQARRRPGNRREEVRGYVEMMRLDATSRMCVEVTALGVILAWGDYTHPRKRIEKFVRDAIGNCQGSWRSIIKNLLRHRWYGEQFVEMRFETATGKKKMLAEIRALRPATYNYEGRMGEITHVVYQGADGEKKLDYVKGLHLVHGSELAGDEVYGSGCCEAAQPFWQLHELLMPVLAIAGQRQATPILVKKTETGADIELIDPETGMAVIDPATGQPILINKGWDSLKQLEAMGSAGVTVIDPDDDLYSVDLTIQGDFLLNLLKVCETYRMSAFLVPSTLYSFSQTGVGDAGLAESHRTLFEDMIVSIVESLGEALIEGIFRPMIDYNFGPQSDYGWFPAIRSEKNVLELSRVIADVLSQGTFSKADIEAINRLRSLVGLDDVTEDEWLEIWQKDGEFNSQSEQEGDPDAITDDAEIEPLEDEQLDLSPTTVQFAGKKGSATKTKNCKKGIPCGGSCISASKTCKKNSSELSSASKEKVKQVHSKNGGGGAGSTSEPLPAPKSEPKPKSKSKSKPDPKAELVKQATIDKAKLDPDFHDFYDLASGLKKPTDIKLSAADEASAKKFMDNDSKELVQNKIKKIQTEAPNASKLEAQALATWIGQNYAPMNQVFYAKDSLSATKQSQVLATDKLAAVGLHKIKPITAEKIAEEAAKKDAPFDPNKPLNRFVTIPNAEGFVKSYQDAVGGSVRESVFFATTHLQQEDMGYFSSTANIRYTVKPKLDGTGQGRYIDHFKNSASEGEILFPPQSKFKVLNVTSNGSGITKAEENAVKVLGNVDLAKTFNTPYGNGDWKKEYEWAFGEKPPSAQKIKKLEPLKQTFDEKYAKLKAGEFLGWTIELEEE